MSVCVPVSAQDAECKEWCLVELQGVLQSKTGSAEISQVGLMSAPKSNRSEDVQLTIGYHQIEGKTVKLKKPQLILEKVLQGSGGIEYKVVGVIKSKYLFKSRPKALISKPLSGR